MIGRWLALFLLLLLLPGVAQAQTACTRSLQNLVDSATSGAVVDVPACTYRETVTIRRPITLDGHGQAIIDGAGQRERWMWIASSDVVVRGLVMRNAATLPQEGAIGTQAGVRNVTIDHNDLGSTKQGEPLGIGGTTDSRVTNNVIHDGGGLGLGTFQNVRLLVQGNHIHHNNTSGADPYWEAGGIKAVADTDAQFLDNEIDHNQGPALWCDIGCSGVLIARNTIHDQPYNPIFYEISSRGEIRDNTISSSAGSDVWGCIIVASSASTYVHGNTCTDSEPLRAQLDNRNDKPADAGTGNRLENNVLVRPVPNQATSWWQYDPNGPLVPGKNGNTDIGNVIQQALPAPTAVPAATKGWVCNLTISPLGAASGTCVASP